MPAGLHPSRVDTLELKLHIERKIGHAKAERYFYLLSRYLSLKISKAEFDRLCIGTIGRENICLHNRLIRAVLKNACVAKTSPPKESKTGGLLDVKVRNGYQSSSFHSLFRDSSPQSPQLGRTLKLREQKFKDCSSPLGPLGKTYSTGCEDSVPKTQEQLSAAELLSLGVRVEEGEEVEQAAARPSVFCRSSVRAPLGLSIPGKQTRKVPRIGSVTGSYTYSCLESGELPDTRSLKTRLEQKLETEGLKISPDCVSLLNISLDAYLKRLIKPALELAGSRSGNNHLSEVCDQTIFASNGMRPMGYIHKANRPVVASLLDFRVAMESNPRRLGEDWPVQLEKVCMHALDQA